MENKTCSQCKQSKQLDEFTQSKGKAGSWCKKCHNLYVKKKGYSKYSRRSEYFTNYQRELRKTVGNKQYEKEFRSAYHASFSGTVGRLLSSARDRSKKNGLEIDIDREWVEQHLEPMKCEATGVDLILDIDKSVTHTAFRPSIDRIDNNGGYTKDNCRITSVIYNKAKSDYTDGDVLKMAVSLVRKESNNEGILLRDA